MIPVFIDTNIYEQLGYNFDDRNQILKSFKKLIEEKEVHNVMISVIDGEIKAHLENRIIENKKGIKKHCKWITEIIDEDVINEKLSKDKKDYEKFKENTKTEIIKISDIDAEIILEKYFKIQPPFENKKRNEFKDAFFVEAISNYIKKNLNTRYVVITKDEGVQKAIQGLRNSRIEIVSSIQQLTDIVINYGSKRKEEIMDYIKSYDLKSQIEETYSIDYLDIEEENIDIDDIDVYGVFGIDILRDLENSVLVACDVGVVLKGEFSCLNYDNSYYSSEEREYLYKEYINKNELMFICNVIIEAIKGEKGFTKLIVRDFPVIEINYENMKF